MKKSMYCIIFTLFFISFISATPCNLDISVLNQDPYPAIPGEYVEIVFKVDGIENSECGKVTFELLEKYPIVFDPNTNTKITTDSGEYNRDYSSFLMVPYKVRVDEDALNGNNPIEVQYKYASSGYQTKTFNLNIQDSRADFEIYIKNYNLETQEMSFEILSIAEIDVEALTIEIPKQKNIEIKESKTNIVGNLDSNEYTTADFIAIPKAGEILLKISYTDSTNARRTLEKTIIYEPEYFKAEPKKTSTWTYITYILIIAGILYFFYRRNKKKKAIQKISKK